MGERFSVLSRAVEAVCGVDALRTIAGPLSTLVLLTTLPSAALASPDCSNARLKSSGECDAKLQYCLHTSIVLVLAVRARRTGTTESDNFARLTSHKTHEIWFVNNRDTVKDIVHQVYTKDATYKKLSALIAPSMALAVSALTSGCDADPSVTVEPR